MKVTKAVGALGAASAIAEVMPATAMIVVHICSKLFFVEFDLQSSFAIARCVVGVAADNAVMVKKIGVAAKVVFTGVPSNYGLNLI